MTQVVLFKGLRFPVRDEETIQITHSTEVYQDYNVTFTPVGQPNVPPANPPSPSTSNTIITINTPAGASSLIEGMHPYSAIVGQPISFKLPKDAITAGPDTRGNVEFYQGVPGIEACISNIPGEFNSIYPHGIGAEAFSPRLMCLDAGSDVAYDHIFELYAKPLPVCLDGFYYINVIIHPSISINLGTTVNFFIFYYKV